jgi:hypothetical protein
MWFRSLFTSYGGAGDCMPNQDASGVCHSFNIRCPQSLVIEAY